MPEDMKMKLTGSELKGIAFEVAVVALYIGILYLVAIIIMG